MRYAKNEAKDHAREHMRGIWAAALNPFAEDLSFDERGSHWDRAQREVRSLKNLLPRRLSTRAPD